MDRIEDPGSGPGTINTRSRSFKRGYIACNSCRQRKARCIIGDEPPCAKCHREYRECVFDHRPKAPKQREAPRWTKSGTARDPASSSGSKTPSRINTSPRNRPWSSHGAAVGGEQGHERVYEEGNLAQHSTPPLTTASDDAYTGGGGFSETSSHTNSHLYNRVMSTVVTGSNDALDILSDSVRPPQDSAAGAPPPCSQSYQSVDGIPGTGPTVVKGGASGLGFTICSLSEADDDVLDMWDRCRFVRQGWFTSQEAVTYIDLFYKHLAPLTPVVFSQYSDHASHTHLVTEEAMLCCTMLMISSRFFMLPGSGGASRSHYVHQRLWGYCENLIKRIMLGQEKHSTAKIRVVGTIESLLLISDWHPRALHFPPETEGWDGMLISPAYDRRDRQSANKEEPLVRWREDVFEPAKRANRMSWMLLGMATNLGYEIGILSSQIQEPQDPSDVEGRRRFRVQRFLYTYVTQTATRLGLSSTFPESISMAISRSSLPKDHEDETYQARTHYMDLNLRLTQLSSTASSIFFQSPAHLQNQVSSDHYADLLDHFSTSLLRWEDQYNAVVKYIHEPLRDALLIEYHHLKACTGAVSIQAVVARASASGLQTSDGNPGDSLSAFVTSKDTRFLHDVILDSRRVLQIATLSAFRNHLSYTPARIKISVISASVFLLKALSVGSSNTDVRDALHALDQCTAMLKASPPDDMDFALRYATLVEKHTAHFRANLTLGKTQMQEGTARIPVHENSVDSTGRPVNFDVDIPSTIGLEHPVNYLDSVNFGMGVGEDNWIGLPFDAGIAPFNAACDQLSLGLDVDSLNFLWSLPGITE